MKNFVGVRSKNFGQIFRVTFIAVFAALLTMINFMLVPIPNVEIVTAIMMLAIISFTPIVGFGIVNVYCTLNLLIFMNDDSLMYFIIFNIYALIAFIFRKQLLNNKYLFIFTIAIMGYTFGTWYAIEKWFVFGKSYAITYWINGLIFDFIHGTGNALIGFFLHNVFLRLLKKFENEYFFIFNKPFKLQTKYTNTIN